MTTTCDAEQHRTTKRPATHAGPHNERLCRFHARIAWESRRTTHSEEPPLLEA